MNKSSAMFLGLVALVISCAIIAGCSDSSSSPEAPNETAVTTASAVSPSALYAAGDIIKNPASTSTAGLLIIAYDASSDKYERAYIYPKSDGSWGYRLDAKTEKISRSTIEKLYTKKVGTITVSSVPTQAPAVAATAAATVSTRITTVATTATATTSGDPAPVVKGIDPFTGTAGKTVSITELEGLNFKSGANVTLEKSGESSITATDVSVSSSTKITCKFVIPSGTAEGQWNVVVRNPDGKYYTYSKEFYVYKGSTTTTTTTTTNTTSAASTVTLTSVLTDRVTTGGTETSGIQIIVMGTNLGSGSHLRLTNSAHTITGTNYYAQSNQMAQDMFTIPSGGTGTYTVSVLDSSGTVLDSVTNGLTIQ